ncbi:uncharacterized protein GGS22DRAFT_152802 [Annulohypoxylon maeteangense]|uniref:uncharacterized protein n=1 Tax=Annulohypoxylon maeteangense TaxID=1927788 RepID=UPI0020078ECE|nr:uncharacterized protein GGS22DRAFT_152802 [Annulohypoxylon maeteangense]KAI0888960.1 hypothetical protein GGS22DRAFT_152802 [Annulohypoxylon maeteangense]
MSLHRWSLPSRGFNREKSHDSDSSQRKKFPTIHIGNPGSRRRANLSSAFACLFDKDENRQIPLFPADGNNTKELLPLSNRIENIPSPSRLKDGKQDPPIHQLDAPNYKIPKDQVADIFTKQDEVLKQLHPVVLLNECGLHVRSSGVNTLGAIKSPTNFPSVRSASSSYPSEGLRSPPEHSVSPPLNTWSESFMSEMTRYGPYPSQKSSSRSTISTTDISTPSDKVGQCLMEELAAVGGISDSETRTTSRDYTSNPLSDITTIGSSKELEDNSSETCHDSESTTRPEQEVRGLSLTRGNGIHLLDGQFSSTSAVYGSFLELESSFRHGSSSEEFPFRPSNTGSLDRLRQSIETSETRPTKIQWGKCNTMPASISQKPPLRDRLAITSAHFDNQNLPGLHFRGSSESSSNLVQRIHKFKFRKWIKKVCLRTKVRFDSAIRIEASSPKALGRRKLISQKLQRAKRGKGAYKAKSKPKKVHWKHPKVATKIGGKPKDQKGRGHRFIRSLHKKNSIQLPVQLPDEEKSSVGHRRVQSCPA